MAADPERDRERQRTRTEKGHEYAKDIKYDERKKTLRTLDKETKQLHEVLSRTDDEASLRSAYSKWMTHYEVFLYANEDYQRLITTTEAEKDCESLKEKIDNFESVKRLAEQKLQKPQSFADDTASQRSCRSNTSTQISLEKMKEGQRKAELLARAEALAEKQRLEEEKLKLKQREEALTLRTEMNISDAKSKVIEELERSMMADGEPIMDRMIFQNNGAVLNLQEPTKTKTEKDFQPFMFDLPVHEHSNHSERVAIELLNVCKELNKPKSEIQKFGGNPLEFKRFMRQFDSRVNLNTDSYDEKLNFLLQFTYGEAHKIVSGYSNLEAEVGYKASLNEFHERYGNPEIIARAYVKKVLEWPIIKQEQAKGLDEYSVFLRECLFAVQSIDAIKVLEYSENLKLIMKKLPYYMHDKWRNVVYELRTKNMAVTFEHLVEFVRREARKANDPVYGREPITPTGTGKRFQSEQRDKKTRNSFATVVTSENSVNHGPAFAKPCLLCTTQHTLEQCANITKKPLKDRYSFLKTKGLCFACLKPGHMRGLCRNKLTCEKCSKPHPTILHVEPRNEDNGNQSRAATYNSQANATPVSASSYAASTGAGALALPVIPVKLKHKCSDKYIVTYAFLDTGSTATFCSKRVLETLGIKGKQTKINLVTMGANDTQEVQKVTGLEISSLNGENSIELPPVLTQESLPFSKSEVAKIDEIANWPHLRNITVERIDSEIDLLIGVNVPKAMEPWDIIPSENQGPFAIKTIFGWVVNGPLDISGEKHNQMVRSNYIKASLSLEEQLRDHFNRDF